MMSLKDKRLTKPKFPDTPIGKLLDKADKIKYDKIYNYEYSYFLKTPKGMVSDTETNHKYGNTREGYEKWKNDNPDLGMSYSGVVSVREMYKIDNQSDIVGYMFERKLPDKPWLDEIDKLFDEAWQEFCTELDVSDFDSVEYFLFTDISSDWRNTGEDRISKFKILLSTIEKYNDPDETDFKKLFDKIKG